MWMLNSRSTRVGSRADKPLSAQEQINQLRGGVLRSWSRSARKRHRERPKPQPMAVCWQTQARKTGRTTSDGPKASQSPLVWTKGHTKGLAKSRQEACRGDPIRVDIRGIRGVGQSMRADAWHVHDAAARLPLAHARSAATRARRLGLTVRLHFLLRRSLQREHRATVRLAS